MDNRASLFLRIAEVEFAMWELHLFMDTHPADLQALALHNEYKEKATKLRCMYEEKFGPLTPENGQGVEWVKNPWPWEKEWCDC